MIKKSITNETRKISATPRVCTREEKGITNLLHPSRRDPNVIRCMHKGITIKPGESVNLEYVILPSEKSIIMSPESMEILRTRAEIIQSNEHSITRSSHGAFRKIKEIVKSNLIKLYRILKAVNEVWD